MSRDFVKDVEREQLPEVHTASPPVSVHECSQRQPLCRYVALLVLHSVRLQGNTPGSEVHQQSMRRRWGSCKNTTYTVSLILNKTTHFYLFYGLAWFPDGF